MRAVTLPAIIAAMTLAAPAAADTTTTSTPQVTPATATQPAAPAKITDRNDPDYVKCRMESVIGSHAKWRKVCLTNREWARVEYDGNNIARKIVEDARAGMRTN